MDWNKSKVILRDDIEYYTCGIIFYGEIQMQHRMGERKFVMSHRHTSDHHSLRTVHLVLEVNNISEMLAFSGNKNLSKSYIICLIAYADDSPRRSGFHL